MSTGTNTSGSVQIHWSDRLRLLADGLFSEWREYAPSDDPFAKTCVVVHDNAAMSWLKNHFLLENRSGEILFNVDFVLLPELVNDWLAAETHGQSPRTRRAAQHPYSPGVLTWRIYRELEKNGDRDDYRELQEYIGRDEAHRPRRRYALAQKLATLFDDYLNARYALLRAWESGKSVGGVPRWQETLYRALYEKDPGSYASDYARALADPDPGKAMRYGFPRYRAIHVFDIPFIPHPALLILKKIAATTPVSFWTFNPGGDWLAESKSKREAVREMREKMLASFCRDRDHLERGDNCFQWESVCREIYGGDDREQLLGAFASGARALLCDQLSDDSLGGVSAGDVLSEPHPALDFDGVDVSVHCAFSPQRELEALKDEIEFFLVDHPEAGPRDILILCADWNRYLPYIGVVFPDNPQAEGYIPVAMAGKTEVKSSLLGSLEKILDFRKNRFEAGAVLDLFAVAAIRRKFGVSARDAETLRDLVKKAGIRWGADDADVDRILKQPSGNPPRPFSWRNGIDRMTLDMLYGEPENPFILVPAGALGKLNPCGKVEGERERLFVALENIVRALKQLRDDVAARSARSAAEWQRLLDNVLDGFYAPQEEKDEKEMQRLRAAVRDLAEEMQCAGDFAENVDAEVFFPALCAGIFSHSAIFGHKDDAILFAPLTYSAATPHRFVWICGLNDGVFPRIDRAASFDLIRLRRSPFDVDTRDQDAYALLKGALGADKKLGLSFFSGERRAGGDPELPVALEDFAGYLRKIGKFRLVVHPRFAYSRMYFDACGESLQKTPLFSPENERIARLFAGECTTEKTAFAPFVFNDAGDTEISLDDFAAFMAAPNRFLFGKTPYLKGNTLDDDAFATGFDVRESLRFLLRGDAPPDENERQNFIDCVIAAAVAPDEAAIRQTFADQLQAVRTMQSRPLKLTKAEWKDYSLDEPLWDLYRRFERDAKCSSETVLFDDLHGHRVRGTLSYRRLERTVPDGGAVDYAFFFRDRDDVFESDKAELYLRHLAACALGKRLFTVFFGIKCAIGCFVPIDAQTAREELKTLLENCAFAPLLAGCPDADRCEPGYDEIYWRDWKRYAGDAQRKINISKR
ncbi:MAG: exodeoxyribonuclease V subunit gamma [Victivallaceae bacterium]|nr:exodeoxyribonuclease V subunit gamma [Victivallaceae bacterium]